ncbi:hypothetical protein [Brucella sp. 22210]|uniref:hypothetical protein n=1 Tax=Brucella sp. 22210 TaxID=3453892 RepID=UPI003F82E2D8
MAMAVSSQNQTQSAQLGPLKQVMDQITKAGDTQYAYEERTGEYARRNLRFKTSTRYLFFPINGMIGAADRAFFVCVSICLNQIGALDAYFNAHPIRKPFHFSGCAQGVAL